MPEYIVDNQQQDEESQPQIPSNYLAFAMICTIVCFAPVGIIALYYSLRVNQYYEEKKYKKARKASKIAGIACAWTIIAGILFWISILSVAFYPILELYLF